MKVTIFKTVYDKDAPHHITVQTALSRIQNGNSQTTIEGGGGGGNTSNPGGAGGTGGGGAGGGPGSAGPAGTANTGGGGGGGGSGGPGSTGGAGGSGIVVVKELDKASGVWSMQSQYSAKRAGTWPQFLPAFICASGGNSTTETGDFRIHTFTSSGTLTINAVGKPSGSTTVDYLVVAGGGGGAGPPGLYGGGGGAGGFRESPGAASGCYTVSPLGTSPAVALPVAGGPFAITVGACGS